MNGPFDPDFIQITKLAAMIRTPSYVKNQLFFKPNNQKFNSYISALYIYNLEYIVHNIASVRLKYLVKRGHNRWPPYTTTCHILSVHERSINLVIVFIVVHNIF